MSQEVLTPDKVKNIFMDCLFQENEIVDGKPIVEPIISEGIICIVGFHPERVKNHTEEIINMLNELPAEFHEKTGGGWSFLNACNDKHGNQWTGLHQTMEQLFQLGIAIGKVSCLLPRDQWKSLPGGVPYYQIKE